jgi:hypothetical protein
LNMVQALHGEYGILAFESRMKARTVICELGSRGCKVSGPEWRIRSSGLTCIACFDEVALRSGSDQLGWSVPATQMC